jgi:Xaa-Pro aminopeptidase
MRRWEAWTWPGIFWLRRGRSCEEPLMPRDHDASQVSSIGRLFTPLGDRAPQLGKALSADRLQALLLTSPESVYYTTGYPTIPSAGNPILFALRNRLPPFAIVTTEGEVSLGCWGFSVEGVELSVDRVLAFNDRSSALDELRAAAIELVGGTGRLGIETNCPYFVSRLLSDELGPERLSAADHIITAARLIKSPEEIDRLTRSLAIVEASLTSLYGQLEVGTSRLSAMRLARREMIGRGASGIGHVTFTFGATNPEIALDEPLRPDQLVVLDMGAIVDGYCSDNRRYAYAGDPPEGLLALHREMVEIVDAVGEALLPGTPYAEIQELARSLHRDRGIPMLARFSHTGHNIGLETEEEWIDDRTDASIRSGMVINIELYSLTDDGQQVGDEETYVIEESPTRISQLSRDIRVI